MNRRLIALSVGVLAVTATEGRAQTGPGIGTPMVPGATSSNSRVGTRGANFLEIGLGARAMGMAGAYAALAEGLPALYWNLAGTADAPGVAGGINYSQLYGKDGFDFVWGGAVMPVGGGVVGLQVGQMGSGNIPRTSFEYPQGGDPTVGSTFNFTSTMATVSYARRLTDRLSVGLGAKFASEGIQNAKANYFGGDFGIKFRTGLYGTTLGASLANVGSSGRYTGQAVESNTFNTFVPGILRVNLFTQTMEMPTIFRFSVMTDVLGGPDALLSQSSGFGTLRAVGEFANAIDTDLQSALGAEYGWRNMVFLRVGKRWLNESYTGSDRGQGLTDFSRGLGMGGGVRLPFAGRHIQFDYAWQGTGELPANNHFSFEFGF